MWDTLPPDVEVFAKSLEHSGAGSATGEAAPPKLEGGCTLPISCAHEFMGCRSSSGWEAPWVAARVFRSMDSPLERGCHTGAPGVDRGRRS